MGGGAIIKSLEIRKDLSYLAHTFSFKKRGKTWGMSWQAFMLPADAQRPGVHNWLLEV